MQRYSPSSTLVMLLIVRVSPLTTYLDNSEEVSIMTEVTPSGERDHPLNADPDPRSGHVMVSCSLDEISFAKKAKVAAILIIIIKR